jgi:hypothetical protein
MSICVMLMTAGPSNTVNKAGNMQNTRGIKILTGKRAAAISAANRRLVLSEAE